MLPTRRKSIRPLQASTTMPSKLESQGKSHVISPVLFMTVDGEPMRFYLCPGPVKVELQPHIKAGGGMVCKAQEPGAILLVDPDVGSLMESTAHWYVSAQYVRDCIEKSEQLELEDYRMRSDATDAQSTKKKTPKTSSTDILTGRSPYTPKEDTAIVGYVSSRNGHKGTLLWREMEKKLVTAHSWQSMKHRYISKLMARPSGAPEDGGGNAGSSEMAENQGAHGDGSSPEKHRASLSEDLTSSDLAQPDDQQPEDQQTDQPIEAGRSESTNVEPPMAEEEEEVVVGAEEEAEEEAPPLVPAKAPQHTSSPVRSQKNKTTTTASEPEVGASPGTPLRRSFRCPTLPHTPPSDTPSRKKARTSAPSGSPKASTSTASPSSLPPPAPPAQPASTPTAPPAHQPTESPPLADGAANPATQKEAEPTGKRKEKRKLGVLEMASDEFEDGGESDYEEAPDQLETQKDTQHHPAETASMPPTATPQVATETRTAMETSQVAPKPHLFIFDNESQEECSQPMDCDEAATPVGPRPIGKKGEVVSETQAQLEEDMQRIRELVKQTNQDLVSVTKALLKTSGDFSSALALLLNPASAQGPPWSRRHDRLLLTSDPKAHRQLRKRYGEQSVARRLAFLNGE